tara:strand:+ start:161 stop:433 length:273 start_codon:yes stop_codon:yes gene_type:complete
MDKKFIYNIELLKKKKREMLEKKKKNNYHKNNKNNYYKVNHKKYNYTKNNNDNKRKNVVVNFNVDKIIDNLDPNLENLSLFDKFKWSEFI